MCVRDPLGLSKIKHSATWFTLVGIAAAMSHYVVAVVLESVFNAVPANANVLGFICAFPVSYFGHRRFSFVSHNTQHRQALPKFLLIAVGGFLTNQALVLLLLRFTGLPFWLVLGFVMVVVALSTYFLSRFWAFKSS
jgi:putative flippase GtrA